MKCASLLGLLLAYSTTALAQVGPNENVAKVVSTLTTPSPAPPDVIALVIGSPAPDKPTVNFYEDNKALILAELANQESDFKSVTTTIDGKVSYLSSVLGKSKRTVVAQSDQIAYKEVDIGGATKKVGYLIRIQAELEVSKANVDFNSLVGIAMAVSSGNASGRLRVKVHGLSGKPIVIPSQTSISESSIQAAMEAVALIRARIHEKDVLVIPQILRDDIPGTSEKPVAVN